MILVTFLRLMVVNLVILSTVMTKMVPPLSKEEEKVMIQISSEKANFIVKNVIQVNLLSEALIFASTNAQYVNRLFNVH